MTLFSFCGVHALLSGQSFQRIIASTFAPIVFFVEVQRFFAAAVEEQVRLHVH